MMLSCSGQIRVPCYQLEPKVELRIQQKITLSKVILICSRPFRLCVQAWLDTNANLGLSPFSEFLTSKDGIDLGAEKGALFI